MALPREQRIKKKTDFEGFKKKSRTLRRNGLSLRIKTGIAGERRFSVVVSKSAGNAVKRNRAKRVVSEWIRVNMERFEEGCDYLIAITEYTNSKETITTLREIFNDN